MVRTAVLRSFLGSILRFSPPGHPRALGGSYVALWRLPRPDLHRQANGDFQGTPRGDTADFLRGDLSSIERSRVVISSDSGISARDLFPPTIP